MSTSNIEYPLEYMQMLKSLCMSALPQFLAQASVVAAGDACAAARKHKRTPAGASAAAAAQLAVPAETASRSIASSSGSRPTAPEQ
jgi:hypothetical protein